MKAQLVPLHNITEKEFTVKLIQTLLILLTLEYALLRPAYAAPGDVDSNYGLGGVVSTPFGDVVVAAENAGSNRVLVAGLGHNSSLARFTQLLSNGDADTTFVNNGHAEFNIPALLGTPNFSITNMARSASQETLFIGYTIGPNGADGVFGKLDQAGNLDSSFANGIGVMNLKSIAPFNGHVNLTPYVLAVDSSDRIYVAMRKRYGTLLARFLPSGQLDSTFSITGVLSVSFPQGGQYAHMPVSLSINLNGEITYAYWALTASGTALTTQVITKLDSSGAVISSFGNAGNMLVPANNGAEFVDMEVDQSNRMLLLTSHCQISRYFATGVLDTSFGVNDTTASLTGLGGGSSVCRGLTLRPTGAPIISGTYQANPTSSELLVARFDNTGNLVSSFANGGVAIIGQPQFSGNVDGNGYAFTVLQSSGRILAAVREQPYYHNFAVTALEDTPLNIVPRPANLGQRNNVALNTLVYSDPIMIDGLNTNSQVLLSITEGEYSVNNGSFTSQHGDVSNGDVITVRHTSRNCYRCRARSVIKIGGFLDQKNGHQRIGQTMRTQFNSFTYGLTSWPVR